MSSENVQWSKSSFCQSDGCIGVQLVGGKVAVGVVDGDSFSPRILEAGPGWDAFIAAAKAGEFDRDRLAVSA